LILSVSQLQTQQMMTSQIRSHIEHLIQTYDILVIIIYSKSDEKSSFIDDYNAI